MMFSDELQQELKNTKAFSDWKEGVEMALETGLADDEGVFNRGTGKAIFERVIVNDDFDDTKLQELMYKYIFECIGKSFNELAGLEYKHVELSEKEKLKRLVNCLFDTILED